MNDLNQIIFILLLNVLQLFFFFARNLTQDFYGNWEMEFVNLLGPCCKMKTGTRMGSLGSNLTCWTRQPNGIGKEGPNSGQRRATGSGISGWVGRAGVFDQIMSLGFGWNE